MRILTLTYLIAFALFTQPDLCAQEPPVAEKGVIDLRGYNFKSDGPVNLTGEYEFYWNQMLSASIDRDTGEMFFVNVPGSWNSLKKEHPEVTRYGFATYRLNIRLPEHVNEIAFRIDDVFSASAYFLNGKAIDFQGFPGVNKYQTVLKYRSRLVLASVVNSEAELLIKVSNFEHRSGGIRGHIELGLSEQMQRERQGDLNRGYFLIGAFMIIGIYFLGLQLIRSERYQFYFALLCLLMAIRVMIINDVPLLEYLNLTGRQSARLEYLNIYLFAPLFILMIQSIFPIEFPRWIFKPILWVAMLFLALTIFAPISLVSFTLTYFFIYIVIVCGLFYYVVITAWIRGRSHAPAFAIGFFILFLGVMNDLSGAMDLINTGFIAHYAMFVFLLVYAYIFANKANLLQLKAAKLTQEIDKVRNHLEDLVEERTTELQSMSSQLGRQKKKLESSNRDLVEAMNARNRLFAIIGHDVKAPIGYTRQALEMILENGDMAAEERDELLRMMASSSEVTYNLLDNLLVWGRSQTGKLKATPVKFKLKSLVDESIELVNIGIREKQLKVEVYVSEEHYMDADRDQLYIVIRNLLSNAIKFTPEKGSIYISSRKQKGEVVISIRDTGIGIPDSIQVKLLDAKSHVSTGGTKGEKGSGLGLKICNEILQTNHGWMTIESELASGTTILIGIKAGRK